MEAHWAEEVEDEGEALRRAETDFSFAHTPHLSQITPSTLFNSCKNPTPNANAISCSIDLTGLR